MSYCNLSSTFTYKKKIDMTYLILVEVPISLSFISLIVVYVQNAFGEIKLTLLNRMKE